MEVQSTQVNLKAICGQVEIKTKSNEMLIFISSAINI